jgi:biopolymer transport protein ExbD
MAKLLSRKSAPFEEPQVNLTPLIDVVFVILIGFILIAPLLEIDKIELANAPSSATSQSPHSSSPISLYVRKDNSVFLGEQPVQIPELIPLLKAAKKVHAHAIPQLLHDKKAYFGTYQEVKNALELAGFEQVDIILKPQ